MSVPGEPDHGGAAHTIRVHNRIVLDHEDAISCPDCGQEVGLAVRFSVGREAAHTLRCMQDHTWTEPRITAVALRRLLHSSVSTPRPALRHTVYNPVRDPTSWWPRWRTLTCPECGARDGLTAEYTEPAGEREATSSLMLECMCMHRWPCPLGPGPQGLGRRPGHVAAGAQRRLVGGLPFGGSCDWHRLVDR